MLTLLYLHLTTSETPVILVGNVAFEHTVITSRPYLETQPHPGPWLTTTKHHLNSALRSEIFRERSRKHRNHSEATMLSIVT